MTLVYLRASERAFNGMEIQLKNSFIQEGMGGFQLDRTINKRVQSSQQSYFLKGKGTTEIIHV